MPNLLNTCGSCAELTFPECDDIVIAPESGLTANTSYCWFVTDQHGNLWKKQVTSSAEGTITIEQSLFPDGMFTSGIGEVTLVIKENESDVDPVTLIWSEVEYTCIQMSFQAVQELISPYGY